MNGSLDVSRCFSARGIWWPSRIIGQVLEAEGHQEAAMSFLSNHRPTSLLHGICFMASPVRPCPFQALDLSQFCCEKARSSEWQNLNRNEIHSSTQPWGPQCVCMCTGCVRVFTLPPPFSSTLLPQCKDSPETGLGREKRCRRYHLAGTIQT